MNKGIRNILSIVLGLLIGGVVNMTIITFSHLIVAPPEGADVTTMEGLKTAMLEFEFKHFLMPFLAHALGTFVGALLAAMIAATRKLSLAMVVGVAFLAAGIAAVIMLPSPLWFSITDLVLAYIPMAYLGYKLGSKRSLAA